MFDSRINPIAPLGSQKLKGLFLLLGPAFVAAVSYVDPGNVASNSSAGAEYGYLLVWVLVVANVIAVIMQYQSAKLGIVTGKTLPQLIGEHSKAPWIRYGYWLIAETIAIATDLAEVVGGALAINLLFGVHMIVSMLIIAVVSMLILVIQKPIQQIKFELVIIALLLVVTLGFLSGLLTHPPQWGAFADGLIPRFQGKDSVLLAASMVGATVMPHAIYLHSGLVIDRFGHRYSNKNVSAVRRLLQASKVDVVIALIVAGAVNIGLLVFAAVALHGVPNTDTIEGAYYAIKTHVGPLIAVFFAIALLFSGIASSSVGSYAGSVIMDGLIHKNISPVYRRLVTIIPAIIIISLGISPSFALILSQVVLSFGIPFAIIPLARFTASKTICGIHADSTITKIVVSFSVIAISVLNILLVYLQLWG